MNSDLVTLNHILATFGQEQLEEQRLSAEQWQQHAQQLEQKKEDLEQELLGPKIGWIHHYKWVPPILGFYKWGYPQ